MATQDALFDPAGRLKKAGAEKDAAVRSWAALRRSHGDFPNYTLAIRACHRECGELFGVWAENADVTIEQVQKATRHVRERIKEMRRGN